MAEEKSRYVEAYSLNMNKSAPWCSAASTSKLEFAGLHDC